VSKRAAGEDGRLGRISEITDRGLLYPLLGVTTVTALLALVRAGAGEMPGPVAIANLYLIGLGVGLIVARIGRLGPFEGVLGSPWFESSIQEILGRETARALRYHRDLTIVALRHPGERKSDPQRFMRATDQMLRCRDGWLLLVLPETDRTSALLLLRRACADLDVVAALVSPDAERPRQKIESELLELIKASHTPGNIAVRGQGTPEFLPLAG
jgi:hypothetical protein